MSLPTAAQADPDCVDGGVYVLFARGSGATIGSDEANAFYWSLIGSAQNPGRLTASGVSSAWAELGNLDKSVNSGQQVDSPAYEYPAAGGPNVFAAAWAWVVQPGYGNSVKIGTDELVKHLNQRYAPVSQGGRGCSNETVILGGYSQGADVVGWALARFGTDGYTALTPAARSHIGSVALYGDPKYLGNFGGTANCFQPTWAIVSEQCPQFPTQGILGARVPYVPNDIWSRVNSYCDQGDGVCHGNLGGALAGTHTYAYKNWMIADSANRIAAIAISKRNQLNPSLPSAPGGQTPSSGPAPQTPNPADLKGATSESSIGGGVAAYDGVIRINGTNGVGVNLRSAPSTSSSVIGNLAEGTVVHPDCYTHGQNVGGTTLWWKVNGGYYTSFYDTVPLEWQSAIETHYGIQNCNAPPPDSDNDGTPDVSDACPHVYVADASGCPGKSDFSLDGKSDVLAFYRYDGQMVNLWAWNGQSNMYSSGPYVPWGAASGWEGSRLIPAGTGDFNGDKMQDTAAFYAYDNGAMGLDLWLGNTQAGLDYHQGWYVPSSWEQARLVPAGVGDFNGDGRADVAAFYYYDGLMVNLYIWYGQADGSMSGPNTVWTGNGWDGTKIMPVGVGDVDGDGHMDISTFYDHGSGMMDQNVWYGDGAGHFTLGRPWAVPTGSGWDGSRFIPVGVADVNGDGKADTIAIFRHDGNVVDMRTWYGTANRIGAADPGSPWSASSWDGNRIIPAGTGDYNGDGKMDIAAFYRYDGQAVGLNIWYGDGSGLMTPVAAWYDDHDGWEGARVIPPGKG